MISYLDVLDSVGFFCRCGLEVGVIGASCDGRLIPYVFVGSKTGRQIIVTGGIHAREHLSTYLVIKQIEYAANNTVPLTGVYFIPIINPDGNMLICKGIGCIKNCDKKLLHNILMCKDRALYKANARGVDLNVNFDAEWGSGKFNSRVVGTENYIGEYPFSENESRALRDFTLLVNPSATVSYHCKGQEIYYEFSRGGNLPPENRDFKIAQYLNQKLNYKILPDDGTSAGGYKDWCIQKLKIPSFTIELASDDLQHPINDYSLASEDINNNLDLPLRLLTALKV